MDVKDFYFSYFQAGKISIDSRKIEKGTVFFAFSGENFDAATKAEDVIQNGAAAVIVEKKEYEPYLIRTGEKLLSYNDDTDEDEDYDMEEYDSEEEDPYYWETYIEDDTVENDMDLYEDPIEDDTEKNIADFRKK